MPTNLGSMGAGQPGMQDALQAAFTARGASMPAPALNQQSSAPNPQSPQGQAGLSVPRGSGIRPATTEAEMLGKAIDQRLRSISKIQEAQIGIL